VGEAVQPVLDLAEPYESDAAQRLPTPRAAKEGEADDGDWIVPRRSFWPDLVASFIFFMNPGNLIAFISLATASVLVAFVQIIPFLGCFTVVLVWGVNAYICAFLLATVRETAAGEDDLPAVWISSVWDDLVLPGLQFAGTWLFVLLPAIALACYVWWEAGDPDLEIFSVRTAWQGKGLARAVPVLMLAGLFFWPTVVLAVAIGGTFAGLWPHVVIRTALCAPLAYLAICAALITSYVLSTLPTNPSVVAAAGPTTLSSLAGFWVASEVAGLYSSIVSMRVIGLFYRHYKHRFPWVAE